MRSHPVLFLVLFAGFGCTGSKTQEAAALDSRIAKLEQEESRRTAKLVELEGEIEAAELSLANAQTEAKRAECRAQRAVAEARLTEAIASCGAELAQHEACLARNDASVSKGAAVGCGLGLLAAVVTGGAAAPLTIAGCTGGAVAGKARTATCGEAPNCYARLQTERKQAVRDIHQLEVCVEGDTRDQRSKAQPRSNTPRPQPRPSPVVPR